MARRRKGEAVSGWICLDKPLDITSTQAVGRVRRAFNAQKAGHAGTLDPLATGLLIIVLGRGTKIQDLLMAEDKEYVGTMSLGVLTDSQDADGQVTETREVPNYSREQIDAAFAKFHGDFYQMPPMVSAIKKEGVPLYKLARQGKTVEREPRFVHVYGHEIKEVRLPEIDFRVICSKGFYVRTYAHDIGIELGCGGHLSDLRRTKSGRFSVDHATTIQDIRDLNRETLATRIISLPDVSRMRGA